jgi:hypothetical protein
MHITFDFDGTLAVSVDFCLAVLDKVSEKYMGKNTSARELHTRFCPEPFPEDGFFSRTF